MLVSEAVGRTVHAPRRRRRLRADGQRQPGRDERDRRGRRAVLLLAPRDRRAVHGRRLRAGERAARGGVGAPGAGADERDHRADRGGEVRTPLLLLAADTPAAQIRSNFKIDQDALVESVGAVSERVHGPATAVADTARAVRRAVRRAARGGAEPAAGRAGGGGRARRTRRRRPQLAPVRPGDLDAVAEALARAERPAIIAGRGAVLSGAGPALRRARRAAPAPCSRPPRWPTGCSRATRSRSASPAGSPRRRRSGCSPRPTSMIAFGAALNMWTTRHGGADRRRTRP